MQNHCQTFAGCCSIFWLMVILIYEHTISVVIIPPLKISIFHSWLSTGYTEEIHVNNFSYMPLEKQPLQQMWWSSYSFDPLNQESSLVLIAKYIIMLVNVAYHIGYCKLICYICKGVSGNFCTSHCVWIWHVVYFDIGLILNLYIAGIWYNIFGCH